MTFDDYFDAFLDALLELGVTRRDPASVNQFKKVAKLFRNAGYTPKEAAKLEAEENTQ